MQNVPFNLATFVGQSSFGFGVLGGVVGGSIAAAKNIKLHVNGKVEAQDALTDTAQEMVGSGVATAVGALAVGAVGGGMIASLGTAFVVAVGGKFAWDRGYEAISKQANKRKLPSFSNKH
ncbi:MAG: magnetosome protein MamC [Bacteriovoracaceae bacterium]|nr:magnetosome protein MamC [Bacteriovoracaceae bacterium]